METERVVSRGGKLYERRKQPWTPAMRAAQAARMRKLHKRPGFLKALERARNAGKLGRSVTENAPVVSRNTKRHPEAIHRRADRLFASGWTAQQVGRKLGLNVSLMYAWKHKFKTKGENRENGNNSATTAIVSTTTAEHRAETPQVQHPNEISQFEREHIISALGECRGFLKEYAIRHNLPFQDFTRRVGEILRRTEIR